jgi:hypothetical protein
MVFDRTISFEVGTGRAILWADTPLGARFRVMIDPRYAVDLWGIRQPVEPTKFAAAIREHMGEVMKAATAAFADGELVLELD